MGDLRWKAPLRFVTLVMLVGLVIADGARAAETAKLTAGFDPDRRGARTTILFGFEIGTTDGAIPAGLSGVDLHLPAHMSIATSSLGLASCDANTLIDIGLKGCSSNARIGYGGAIVVVPLGPKLVREHARISAVLGPSVGSDQEVLFYADGIAPVFAQLVFPAQVLHESGALGGGLNTTVPVVPVLPEGSTAAIVRFHSTLGPLHLTYYRVRHGRREPFHPRGVKVPRVCPPGGYPFAADFVFQDGARLTAHTRVPCPRR